LPAQAKGLLVQPAWVMEYSTPLSRLADESR
jgi:hypothetical protein